MEQDNKIRREEIENAGEIKKNKGGRPKGKQEYSSCKVTVYLTGKEYELLTEFAKKAWYTFNYSDAQVLDSKWFERMGYQRKKRYAVKNSKSIQ